jgi:hypothetical protein
MLFNHVLKTEEKKLVFQKEAEEMGWEKIDSDAKGKGKSNSLDFVTDPSSGKRFTKARIQQMLINGSFT